MISKLLMGLIALVTTVTAAHAQQVVRVLTPDYATSVPLTNRALIFNNATGKQSWICEVGVLNRSGATVYVQLFDTNSLPGAGAIPSAWHPVTLPTDSQASISFPSGYPLQNGLAIGTSSTPNSYTASGTSCWFSVTMYRKSN